MYQCSATLTIMSQHWVPDDVWIQLSPRAARLTAAQRWKGTVWVAVAALIALAIVVVFASGLIRHRLGVDTFSASGTDTSCGERVTIVNNGWFDETVLNASVQSNGTNATLARPFARTIPSGESRTVSLRFAGAYCGAMLRRERGAPTKLRSPSLVLV